MTGPEQGELLSALPHGEVSPDERARAEALLASDPSARSEYAGLAAVKEALRGLPAVDAPFGFYERMLRRGSPGAGERSWWRSSTAVVASVVATAAAWVLLAGVAAPGERLLPPLDDVTAAQADVSAFAGAGGPFTLRDGGMTLRPLADGDLPALGGFERSAAAEADGGAVLVVYRAEDGTLLAVFRQQGAVDWDSLPEGERGEHAGAATWRDLTTDGPLERVIVADDGTIYTLVGTADPDELIAIGAGLPSGSGDGLVERARDACEELIDSLSGS